MVPDALGTQMLLTIGTVVFHRAVTVLLAHLTRHDSLMAPSSLPFPQSILHFDHSEIFRKISNPSHRGVNPDSARGTGESLELQCFGDPFLRHTDVAL